MRANPTPADKQFRLIMECCASDLTDHEWYLQHDIRLGTFYNWVKRLRQKGCHEIPEAKRRPVVHKQKVVKVEIAKSNIRKIDDAYYSATENYHIAESSMELSIAGTTLYMSWRKVCCLASEA
ncbi:hypothetical protein SAMN02910358_01442 [Lachnospiraceae bacterium XBB1006]|nr:hypothetical protein SAMN02910358_01442 [Lachnospiraceae bacterium XBB1006]